MKQIEKLKESLEKSLDVNIQDFLGLYEEGNRLEDIIKALGSTQWKVKLVASTLNLRFAKKYRESDLNYLEMRSEDNIDATLMTKLGELTENLEQVSGDFVVQQRALLRARNQTNILRKGLREEASTDSLRDFITSVVEHVKPMQYVPKIIQTTADQHSDDIQFIILSDIHAEEIVEPSAVPSGEYNWEIMEERVTKVFDEACKRNKGYSIVHVYLLGDMVSGFIHGADVNASRHPILAITGLAELLASNISSIAEGYTNVRVFTTTGNHDRLTDTPSVLNKSLDFSYLLYKLMESHLKVHANVIIDISENGTIVAPIGIHLDRFVGLHHGDQISNKNPLQALEFFRGTLGVDVNHIIQGHYHVPKVESLSSRGFSITNGSVIGPGSYSHVKGFLPTPWSQTIGVWGANGNLKETVIVSEDS